MLLKRLIGLFILEKLLSYTIEKEAQENSRDLKREDYQQEKFHV